MQRRLDEKPNENVRTAAEAPRTHLQKIDPPDLQFTKLDISIESVKSHIKILLEKLGAASRAEAASIAIKKRLLRP